MDLAFWGEAWSEGRTAFHSDHPRDILQRYRHLLAGPILVPLCGRSGDLVALRRWGYQVVGVEAVRAPLEELLQVHKWPGRWRSWGGVAVFSGPHIELWNSDYLALPTRPASRSFGPFPSLYDRAALIALPPDQWGAYAQVHRQLLAPQGRLLLEAISFTSPAPGAAPPFSVPAEQVRRLFSWAHRITVLETWATAAAAPRLCESGVKEMRVSYYLIEKGGKSDRDSDPNGENPSNPSNPSKMNE